MQCLEDENVFVRRAAVNAVSKLFNINPHFFLQHNNFVDKLKCLVGDKDGVVMVNSLMVLDELMRYQYKAHVGRDIAEVDDKRCDDLKSEIKGVETNKTSLVITKSLVTHLLSKFQDLCDSSKVLIIGIVHNFKPQHTIDVLWLMNSLDPYINNNKNNKNIKKKNNENKTDMHGDSGNKMNKNMKEYCDMTSMTTSIVSLFIHLVSRHLPHLKKQVLNRTSEAIFSQCHSQSHQVTWAVLSFIGCHNNHTIKNHILDCNRFVSSPFYLKMKKISLIVYFMHGSDEDEENETLSSICCIYRIESSVLVKERLIYFLGKLLKMCCRDVQKLKIINVFLSMLEKEKGNFRMTSKIVEELVSFEIVDGDKGNIVYDEKYQRFMSILCKHTISHIANDRLPIETLIKLLMFLSSLVLHDCFKCHKIDSLVCLEEDLNTLAGFDTFKDGLKVDGDDDNVICKDKNIALNDLKKESVGNVVLSDLFSGIQPLTKEATKKDDFKFDVLDKDVKIVHDLPTSLLYKIEDIIDLVEAKIKFKNYNFLEKDFGVILIYISGLFIAHPAVYQHLLGRIFEIFYSSEDPILKFKSDYFNKILKINFDDFKNIVNNVLKIQ